jgi:superfamily II DNA or RNA helicase
MKTLPAWTAPLRDWQRRALSAVCAHPAMDFLAMATPAAGKTRFALAVAHHYLTAGAAVRVLVVCPTNHLRGQWSDAAGNKAFFSGEWQAFSAKAADLLLEIGLIKAKPDLASLVETKYVAGK